MRGPTQPRLLIGYGTGATLRPTGQFLKISLHASGRFRVAFHDAYHKNLIDKGIVDPAANRAVTVWDRPDGEGKVAWLAVSILLPADFYHTLFNKADFTKATNLFSVDHGNALEIGIFLSHRFSDDLEGKLEKIGLPVWYADLENVGTFSVVVRQRPFDPAVHLPKPVQIPVEAFHNSDDLPTDDAPVRTGLGSLLFNDPVAEGVLRVTEVSGVTLTKNSAAPVATRVSIRAGPQDFERRAW
ncbi:hypothetical protein D9M68_354240 [compost metagenome]